LRTFVAPLLASLAALVPARADTVLVDEILYDGSCGHSGCTVEGGSFMGGGFQVTSGDSRLVFDLGQDVPCGELLVEFTNFDPIDNGHTGEYVNVLGLYEDDHGNNWSASNADEAQLQIQGTCDQCVNASDEWRDYRLKFKAGGCSWDIEGCEDGNAYVPTQSQYDIDWAATMGEHYTAAASWSCSVLHYEVGDGTHLWSNDEDWAWHPEHADPRPHFRYLFVGKDHSGASRYIDEAIYSYVYLAAHDECDCGGGDDDDDVADDDDTGGQTDDDTTAADDDAAADDDTAQPGDDDGEEPGSWESGCGCRAEPPGMGTGAWILLLATLWPLLRRIRR